MCCCYSTQVTFSYASLNQSKTHKQQQQQKCERLTIPKAIHDSQVHLLGDGLNVLVVFPGGLVVKSLPANTGDAGDMGSMPGSGKSSGERNGNPLQYSCLGHPMDQGA